MEKVAEYLPVDLSDDQRKNLAALAAFLPAVPPELFHMNDYECKNECGTTHCAAGYGPSAGIPKLPEEHWGVYCGRVFGVVYDAWVSKKHRQAWCWLFSSSWQSVDNTPDGAATRIRILLDKGVPVDNFGYAMKCPFYCVEDPT